MNPELDGYFWWKSLGLPFGWFQGRQPTPRKSLPRLRVQPSLFCLASDHVPKPCHMQVV